MATPQWGYAQLIAGRSQARADGRGHRQCADGVHGLPLRPPAHRRPIADFTAGNPQELPLPGLVEALTRWSVPKHKDWFAYNFGDPTATAAAASALTERLGLPFAPEDILLTRGAFGALELALETVVDPGDEVIFSSPPWFFYEALILHAGGTPVRVRVDAETFDLDVDAIAAAVSARTRALIVNTPHNPTGKIWGPKLSVSSVDGGN